METEKEKAEKAERIRLLVAELRSGRWPQGTNRLARDEAGVTHYCCLGVGCELALAAKLPGLSKRLKGDMDAYAYGACVTGPDVYSRRQPSSLVLLPWVVQEWFGFEFSDPKLYIPHALAVELAERRNIGGVPLKDVWSALNTWPATALNDGYKFSFEQIAECFEYTYLREDWEVRRGTTVS